jgi:3-mercaptopyruvate sulfurtransferase SseA
MRLFILLTLTLTMIAGVVACNSNETLLSQNPAPPSKSPPPAAATPAPDNARRISAEEVHKLWEKNEVVIIDTRAESAYKQEHIKGSISMPTGTVLQRIDELPRNKTIVAYCT